MGGGSEGASAAPFDALDGNRLRDRPRTHCLLSPAHCRPARPRLREEGKFPSKKFCDRVHARATSRGLGLGIVIRIDVQVVRIGVASVVDDELDRSDLNVMVLQESAVRIEDRVVKVGRDLETWSPGLGSALRIGWAQVEPAARLRPQGIQELAADKFRTRDEGVGRLDELLNDIDTVDGVNETMALDAPRELVSALETNDPQPLPATIGLDEERPAEPAGCLDESVLADGSHRFRDPDPERVERDQQSALAHRKLEGLTPVDDSPAVGFEPPQQDAAVLHG